MNKLLLIVMIFFTQVANAEVYYVTFIKGSVKVSGATKNVSVGDKLTEKDQLIFLDKTSKLSCISPAKGRFDITADKSKQNNKKEWVAVLSDLLVPAYASKQLSTRAIGDQHDAESLFKTSHPENKLLLIEDSWIDISSSTLLDKANFFFLQYEVNGKTMVKKLPSNGNAISFNRSLLVGSNGEILAPESVGTIALCYQQNLNGKPTSKLVSKFTPVFLSLTDFTNEVAILRKYLTAPDQNVEKVNNEIYNHFYSNYGFVNTGLFRKLIK